MKRLRNILAASLLVLNMGLVLAVPTTASAASSPKSIACESIGAGSNCNTDSSAGTNVNNLIKLIVNTLSIVIGVTAVIMIMVSGFKYITAGGDSNKVGSAKNTLVYAIIGLVVVALAQVIVQYVLNKLLVSPPKKKASISVPVATLPSRSPGYTVRSTQTQA